MKVRTSVTTNLTDTAESTNSVNKLIHYYCIWYKLKKVVAWILKLKKNLMQIRKMNF